MTYLVVSTDLFGKEVVNLTREIRQSDIESKKTIYVYLGKGEFRELRWCIVSCSTIAKKREHK